jgi:hypothetical protein
MKERKKERKKRKEKKRKEKKRKEKKRKEKKRKEKIATWIKNRRVVYNTNFRSGFLIKFGLQNELLIGLHTYAISSCVYLQFVIDQWAPYKAY